MASAFGLKISVYDPYISSNQGIDPGVTLESDLQQALRQADVVSLHVPNSDQIIIGEAEFAVMKPESILVNTARGGIVDESALIRALDKWLSSLSS